MQTYEILVKNRSVRANSVDTSLVRTSVGVDRAHILFDSEEWLSFPLTVTFANGDVMRTAAIVPTAIPDGTDWVAEATCTIPFEVVRTVGRIRVTVQGTDSDGNHIITAKGSPLSVEEAGDVTMGEVPEDAPTVDEWTQAYDLAMDGIARMNELVAALEDMGVAGVGRLGLVMPDGTTITIDGDGVISSEQYELPEATVETLGGVIPDGTTVTVEDDGTIHAVTSYELPMAGPTTLGGVIPDGVTITIDQDGVIHGAHRYVLPKAGETVLGGIKVGDGIEVAEDGTTGVRYLTNDEIDELTPLDHLVVDGDEGWY